jgi:hypothetical protein
MLVKSNERLGKAPDRAPGGGIASSATAAAYAAYAAFLARGRGPNWLSWFNRQRTVQLGQWS